MSPAAVPEIDAGTMTGALALLGGVLAWFERRRTVRTIRGAGVSGAN